MRVLTKTEKLLSNTQTNYYFLNKIFKIRGNIIIIILIIPIFLGGWVTPQAMGRSVTYNDGSKYVGEFKHDKKHGQGTLTWPDGSKYVGEFKHGKRHGQGTYTWPDGRRYVGEWKDHKKHGQGTLTWPDGSKYVGEVKDGNRHGQGTMTGPDGRKYVGEWKDGNWHGQGTQTWPDGTRYVGEFEHGNWHGQGTITWPDGSKYVGEFGGFEGNKKGNVTSPEGAKYAGNLRFETQITYVEKDSNGERAGLLLGDIIVEYNGITIVNGAKSLVPLVKTTQSQEQVEVKVIRKGVESNFVLNGGRIGVIITDYPRFEIAEEELFESLLD